MGREGRVIDKLAQDGMGWGWCLRRTSKGRAVEGRRQTSMGRMGRGRLDKPEQDWCLRRTSKGKVVERRRQTSTGRVVVHI
jgi:hypothetical protein